MPLLVSIIVPVYKVEAYIIRCIDSVLHQTYRNLEVILIDDNSPDRSMEIAKNYIKISTYSKDIRFVFLKHEKNRGLSVTRNTGILAAKGDYLYFLDSDDEIMHDCIEKLVKVSNSGKNDLICGGVKIIDKYNNVGNSFKTDNVYITGEYPIIQYYTSGHLYMMAWNKLVKKSILNNNILFKEGIIHEDNLWSFLLINQINSMSIISSPTYIYYKREGSIMTSTSLLNTYESLVQILESFNEAEEYGIIKSYPENYSFIDNKKLLWMRDIFIQKNISIIKKISFFVRIVNLNRGRSFMMQFAKSMAKYLYDRC